ncbi:MAG: hypothetical protein L0H59_13515 [Tomitella sp.]|nr:hypothetical protein [Tomitella sp.]
MNGIGLALTVVGAVVNLAGAAWMLCGFNPDSPRYTDDGPLYPGGQKSSVVPRLLQDQRRVAAVAVIGSTLLTVGAVLVFIAGVTD